MKKLLAIAALLAPAAAGAATVWTAPATLKVQGLPVLHGGRVYEVWLERAESVRPAGTLFAVGHDGRGTAAIPADLHGVDRVLVTRERAGGVEHPTERPVISVRT